MTSTAGAPGSSMLELSGEATPVGELVARAWRYRGLLPLLAHQEFHARYRSAKLGVLWSLFVPLFQGAVLAFVFSRIVRIGSGYPFVVYVLVGTACWSYFNTSVSSGATAIVDSGPITTRVYFPRAIQPLVAPAANLPGFSISLAVVVGLMVIFDVPLRATLLLLPLAMLLVVLLACLFSMLVALLHVYFRDVRYLLQAALIGWFYATPLFYSIDMARRLKPLVIANPLVGAIQLARYALFGRAQELGASLVATGAAIAVMTVIALLAYARFDRVAADRM